MKRKEEIINYFKNDKFATQVSGINILEIEEGYAQCSMEVTAQHLNAEGYVMGGAIFTLADFTFGVACKDNQSCTVTLSSNINFISAAKYTTLFAEATCTRKGNKVVFYEVKVVDANGILIAIAQINGYKPTIKIVW